MGLRAKTYSYLTDDDNECVITENLNLKIIKINNKIDVRSFIENHKYFIINNRLILKWQQRFKSERHNVFTGEINKITLSSNDDKSTSK